THLPSLSGPLKQKGLQGEIVPKIGRYNLVKSTTLASKKSHVDIHLRGAPPTHSAIPQPRREGVLQRYQPVLGTHTGTYDATSTVAYTAWQRRQLTVRFPSLYITSNALPCRHAGVRSRHVVRATCTTGA